MKPTMLVLALTALLGLTACAKYPVVIGAAATAPAPTAAAPTPTPTR
jgi:hypothetical protein